MNAVLVVVCSVVIGWAMVSRRMAGWAVSAPLALAAAGAVIGLVTGEQTIDLFNTQVALTVAELILAVLMFADAVAVRPGWRSQLSTVPLRLLFVALPVALLVAVGLGWVVGLVLPLDIPFSSVLLIACIVVPLDIAPVAALLTDRRVAVDVRHWLGVENGYNDGLVAPVFVFGLALAGASAHGSEGKSPLEALWSAGLAQLLSLAVGLMVGAVVGFALRRATRRGWTAPSTSRIAVVALPLAAFGAAGLFHGNGFIAAFASALAYRRLREMVEHDPDLQLIEDVGEMASLMLYLAFGALGVQVISASVEWWPAFVLAAIALVLPRLIGVTAGLVGTRVPARRRIFMGLAAPRGAPTIVLGLLAFNALPDDRAFEVLAVTALVVAGSLVLHTPLTQTLIRRGAAR